MFLNTYILFIAIATTSYHLWKYVFIKSISAAVKGTNELVVVFFTHSTESRFQVVKKVLFACIGYNDLALIVLHHTMTYVSNAERSYAEGSNADWSNVNGPNVDGLNANGPKADGSNSEGKVKQC